MKPLSTILPAQVPLPEDSPDPVINGLAMDSREAVEGGLFAAIPGTYQDGHDYIDAAIAKGVRAVLCQEHPGKLPPGVTGIQVDNPAHILGLVAHNYYDRPSEEMAVVGVTGTNGKTSATAFTHQLLTGLGYRAGLIATTGIFIGQTAEPATHTTPDAITLARLLRRMADNKVTHVFMEVSSHALVQERVTGIRFTGAAFTNLTHEHLDYHGTFQAYLQAKQRLFRMLSPDAFALTNKDDKHGLIMTQDTSARVRTYSLKALADYRARVLEHDMNGMQLQLNDQPLYTPVIGTFNAYNLTLAYGIAAELGFTDQVVLKSLSLITPPKGRMELLHGENGITGIVDYAHSPDALKHVLQTIQHANKHQGQVLVVFGCGGDRDTAKRPQMMRVALQFAHQVIVTTDNPRTEDQAVIAEAIKAGAAEEEQDRILTIPDREQAIKTATKLASKGAIVLIAGKGHEAYQEINGKRYPFDDRTVLSKSLGTTFSTNKPHA